MAFQRTPRAMFASRHDPRFSYCLAIPRSFREEPEGHRLVVVVHGSSRGAVAYRDALAAFAEREHCVVLAPLFPVGPLGDGNGEGYKFLVEADIRYDQVLLAMVEEVETTLDHKFGRFLLSGFSGGGQFAHRFFYLHPDKLLGVAIGAPGMITRIDPERDYWLGTRDWEARFGKPIDLTAMRAVPVLILVGEHDTKELTFGPLTPSADDLRRVGRTRLERTELLQQDFQQFGVTVERHIVPAVGHEGLKMLSTVEQFFARVIRSLEPIPAAQGVSR